MGILDRFTTMVRSNLNDLISRAENPEKMLNQLITDMRTQLDKARQQVAQSIADEKKLEADAAAMQKQAEDWERRAMLAVQEGRDDLAKQALMRYNEALQGAQQLHDTWVKSKTETESLKASLRQLNDKIEEAKRKKNILIARARRAEAQQRIQDTLAGMGDKSAFESFERMQDKIEANERRAIASAELQQEMTGDSLAKQFEQLEYHGSSDQQLLELKAKMAAIGGAKETKQIGQGATAAPEPQADGTPAGDAPKS
jgi:phage shock protein A